MGAEGLEGVDELMMLRGSDCDLGQGLLSSPSVPAAVFLERDDLIHSVDR